VTHGRRLPRAAAAVVALWALAAVLHVGRILDGRLAWVGVWVRAGTTAADAPTVREVWGESAAATAGLVPGDQVERAGAASLAGAGPLRFVAHVYDQAAGGAVMLSVRRGDVVLPIRLPLTPIAFPWRALPLSLAFVVAAAVVIVRRGELRVTRAFFGGALAYAFHWTFVLGGPYRLALAWAVVFAVASTVMLPLLLRVPQLLIYDDDRRRWPWAFAVFGPVSTSWVYGTPLPPGPSLRAAFVLNVLFIVAVLWELGRSYRRAGAHARRQLRWVVWGLWIGTLPVAVADVATSFAPAIGRWHDVAMMTEIAVPMAILIAIVRANLLDIDRILSATAAYSTLCIVALAAGLAVVPRLAGAASATLGIDPGHGQMLLSVLTAVAIVPTAGRLRPRIERVLFAERHALQERISHLLEELGRCHGPASLLSRASDGLHGLVAPERLVVVAPVEGHWTPIVALGRPGPDAVPPALVTRLTEGRRPLHDDAALLSPLGVALALPVFRGRTLEAALLVGPKRSGDVYTPTDVALLSAVADKLSSELLRFDEAEILRQEREMSAALRRYVPDPVAQRLESGRTVEAGERIVSVLFVDIRGYTTLSEGKSASEVFATVSTYTEAVSAVIRRHGGTVVEFLGDGVMAVFGAPEALPGHARAALVAGREIVDAATGAGVAVGVGVATGAAFVGNIPSADRLIYTAIGDTVNLASRLQALTRELGAAIAVDPTTRAEAGEIAHDFALRPAVTIRGRRETVDVSYLPLAR
jgi:class 3 adenylate cyclase